MTSTLGRLAGLATAVAVASTGLTGCGLLNGSSRIEDALEYLPADASEVTFTDRAAIADRQDLSDIETGASDDDVADWSKDQADEGYGTELSRWVGVMQDAAFSDFDLEWEAVSRGDDGLVRVWKLKEDVDFNAITKDLEDAGYERSKEGDAEVFEIELNEADPSTGLFGDRYPTFLVSLALVPGEHVIVSGDVDTALKVVDEDTDSLADEGSFDDLLGKADDQDALEYADLLLDAECSLEGLAVFAAADDPVRVVRLLKDDGAAKDDADAMDGFLDESVASIGLDVDFDIEQDGSAVLIESDFDDRRQVVTAGVRREGPVGCPSGP